MRVTAVLAQSVLVLIAAVCLFLVATAVICTAVGVGDPIDLLASAITLSLLIVPLSFIADRSDCRGLAVGRRNERRW